jgi:hypothetical protein
MHRNNYRPVHVIVYRTNCDWCCNTYKTNYNSNNRYDNCRSYQKANCYDSCRHMMPYQMSYHSNYNSCNQHYCNS